MKFIRIGFFACALAIVLQGCAPVQQKPVSLDTSFWQESKGVVGIAMESVPQPQTYFLGQQGLLDIAINSSNAKPMASSIQSIDTQRVTQIADNLEKRLQARGFTVKRLTDTINSNSYPERKSSVDPEHSALRDFTALKSSNGIDRLLLVTVERLGTERGYYGFVPTSPPKAIISIKGQLIDLSDHKLLWFHSEDAGAAIPEPWDQAPEFANVVATVKENMEQGCKQFEQAMFTTQ